MEQEELTFLQTVLATLSDHERAGDLKSGRTFYRAQLGVDWVEHTDDEGNFCGEDVWGYSAPRMKPLPNRAREGRVNPTGIPALYVANTVETAVSEIRPWVDAEISVATCKVIRPLRTLDLSIGFGKTSFNGAAFRHAMGGTEPTREEKAKAVWIEIDNALSTPVTASDDQADYAPTQILSELFQSAGYDAIAYRSQFGGDETVDGYNLAIFDPSAVEIVSCAPYRVRSIKVEATQIGNPWAKSST